MFVGGICDNWMLPMLECKMDTNFKALISYQILFTFLSQYYNKLVKTVILSEIISPHCSARKLAPSHSNCHCFPQATYKCPILLKYQYIIIGANKQFKFIFKIVRNQAVCQRKVCHPGFLYFAPHFLGL